MVVNPKLGLSTSEVKKLRQNGWANTAVEPPSKSLKDIILSNTLTYFNFVFLLIAVVLMLVQSWRDLTFLPVIVANTLIGIIQELRAKSVLDKLTMLNAPTARVIRDGDEHVVAASHLVLNDIVKWSAGDQIAADAVIVEGSALVNEALLTGEADEIKKQKDDELLSGSFIVSGAVTARLTKVGQDSYISQLTLAAKQLKTAEGSEITRSLNRIVTIAGTALIPIGLILFHQSFFVRQVSLQASVRGATAAMIGLIPEGLFLLSSVTLAIGAMRLARRRVLINDMKSIETLARVDVLCVDKTGTITENSMAVDKVVPLKGVKLKLEELKSLLSDFAFAQDADNATMSAIKNYFVTPSGQKAQKVQGFSSTYKYSAVGFSEESFVLGAPEFLLQENYPKYQAEIEDFNSKGYRVVLFAGCEKLTGGPIKAASLTPLALVLLNNPLRKSAVRTFKFFADQGVEIKVISGDNARTVSEVAERAKIKAADKYIDASTLLTEQSIAEAAQKYTVFGRVTPAQKRKLIKALQEAGHTVGMTGDGVNDVLALRDADCSAAMASGSDAAAQAAQLVLLDSDFDRMPEVVMEGRRAVNNLENSGSLFLVKNMLSFILALFAIFFQVSYPLNPAQISLISLFTVGLPSFLLSLLPNHDLIRGNFVANILREALPGSLANFICIISMSLVASLAQIREGETSTIATAVIAIVGLCMIKRAAGKMTLLKWGIWSLSLLGIILCSLFLPALFGISRLSPPAIIICVAFTALSPIVLVLTTRLVDWCLKLPKIILAEINQANS